MEQPIIIEENKTEVKVEERVVENQPIVEERNEERNAKRERNSPSNDDYQDSKQRKVEIETNSSLPTITINTPKPIFTTKSENEKLSPKDNYLPSVENKGNYPSSSSTSTSSRDEPPKDNYSSSRDNYSSSSKGNYSSSDKYSPSKSSDKYSSSSSKDNYSSSSRDNYSSSDKYSPSKSSDKYSSSSSRDNYSSSDKYSPSKSSSSRDYLRDNYSSSSGRDNYSSSSRDNYSSSDKYSSSSRDNYSSSSRDNYPSRDRYSSRDSYKSSYQKDSYNPSYPTSSSRDSSSSSSSKIYPPGTYPSSSNSSSSRSSSSYPSSSSSSYPSSSSSSYPSSSTSGSNNNYSSTSSSSSYYPSSSSNNGSSSSSYNSNYSSSSYPSSSSSSYPSSSSSGSNNNYSSSSYYPSSSSSDGNSSYPSSSNSYSNDQYSSSSYSSNPQNNDYSSYQSKYSSNDNGSSSYSSSDFYGKSQQYNDSVYGQSKGNASSKENFSHLPQFKKKFYTESKIVAERSQQEINEYFRQHQVNVEGDCPKPVLKFEESNLPSEMMREIARQGFTAPTPIQAVSWPASLSGRDVIGIAQTGSGKTLAFALPMIVHILAQEPLRYGDGPIGLVLSPTRELAQQIEDGILKFTSKVRVCSVFGGVSKMGQSNQLRRGVEIVIACPGRLIDMISSNKTNLKRVTFLCLDEADRMLDMGFEHQIRRIVSEIRSDRQTAMFSATWPKAVKQLATDFLTDPRGFIKINIGSQELRATHTITQLIDCCPEEQKKEKLFRLLKSVFNHDTKILIFCEKKKSTDSLAYEIRSKGFKVSSLHGDKTQSERTWVLRDFSEGRCPILVATDVAARGLDVDNIKYVINFDFPNTSEDYIHRIGRTGRGGSKGTSYSFFNEKKARLAPELISILREANQEIPPELYSMAPKNKKPKGNNKFNKYQNNNVNNYNMNNNNIPNNYNNYQKPPSSHVNSYSNHSNVQNW